MESRTLTCPSCGSTNTELAETLWETGPKDRESDVAPPVPRDAATNLPQFYLWGIFWLIVTFMVMLFLRNHAAYRPESVLAVTIIAGLFGVYQVHRLFTRRPKPTADQEAALAEWHVAHDAWERMRVCQDCRTMFTPDE